VALVAPDAVLRELGETCAGGGPFLYAHATADYRIEDASGRTVVRGTLPEGEAVAAFNHDPGVPRVPTYCRFSLSAEGVVAGGHYRLVLPEGAPVALKFGDDGHATAVLQ